MVFAHPYGSYSVEGSLNAWFRTNLTAAGVPAWMPSARVVFDYPETPLIQGHSGHAFSVTHLGAPEVADTYQGQNVDINSAGQKMTNLMRVDCWVSKQAAGNSYEMRVRQMEDMVTYLLAGTKSVPLTNVYTGAAAPSAIDALIRLNPHRQAGAASPDPRNPDLYRRAVLIPYWWIERT